jgi:putative MATE family efflux protein
MNEKFGTDFSVGSIPKHLLVFSIPMLISSLIQISYNMVNTIWVGHLVGENAVGAAGVSFPIFIMLIGISMGLSLASTILVSQYYGARNFDMVRRVVNNSFSVAVIVGILLSCGAMLSSDCILRLMDTPEENFILASSYLKISAGGFIFMYMGLLIASILRGIGDTVTPLIFMVIGIGLNAILDPFMIGGFGPFPAMGLKGAAWASVFSQAVAFAASVIYLNRKNHVLAFSPRGLALERDMVISIFRIGVPTIVQQSLVSLGMIFLTSFVNSFGAAAINAFGAVGRVDSFVFMPSMSMSMAVATLTGQNMGAGRTGRVSEIFRWGMIMNSVMILAVSALVVFFSGHLLRMFGLGNDLEVMRIGESYLLIVGSCYIFFALMFISNGVINGAGHTIITMCFTLISLWAVRVPLAWYLMRTPLGIDGIWIAISVSAFMVMVVSVGYYLSGRWKKNAVIRETPEVEPPIMD